MRDISKISMRYLRGDFFWEFLPVIPFAHILGSLFKNPNHWYLIKIVRLATASKVFDTHAIYEKIKAIHTRHLRWIVDNDPVLAEDKDLD